MGLENNGPLPGRPVSGVPGRAARRAEGAAQARPMFAGWASPGTVQVGSGRAWAGPKNRAHRRAVGLRAAWTSIDGVYRFTIAFGVITLSESSSR